MTLNELKCKEDLDFSILSERLLLKRTDRPDEWSMDELASMALKIETRVKELEASLRRVREKSTMALSSLSTASKTLREIEGVVK
jgi:hypothetical protein